MSREKLGRRMLLRRRELGLTQEAVRARGGPGLVTQRMLEKGRYDHAIGARLTIDIECSLNWEPGSVDALLAGGEPSPSPAPESSATSEFEAKPSPPLPDVPLQEQAGAEALGAQAGLVHEVLGMRASFAQMTADWTDEARDTLRDQVEKFSRAAEDTLIAALSWLPDEDRAVVYRLLSQLREPL